MPFWRPYLLSLLLLPALAGTAWAEGWRTDGSGRYPKAKPPTTWSATEQVVWKHQTANWSNASPVLSRDRLFLCEEPFTLLCLDAKAGKPIWSAKNGFADLFTTAQAAQYALPGTHEVNGYSSQTPLVIHQGKRIFAFFGNGAGACYDREGKRLWARFIEAPQNPWGHSASPVEAGGRVIIHVNGTVHALDPKDGKEAWTSPSGSTWGTPAVIPFGKEQAILTTGGDLLRASDGKKVASGLGLYPWTSVVFDPASRTAYVIDEAGAWAFRFPAALADPLAVEKAWENPGLTRDRYYASLLVHQGLLYAVNQGGALSVVDAATGALVYHQPLGLVGTMYPSVALAGDRVFLANDMGTSVWIAPGREYKELGRVNFEPFRANPVFEGTRMYLRTLPGMWCLGK